MLQKQIAIEGKVALVTGSNRGIGKAITIALVENGAKKVYAGARNSESLQELKAKYGDRLIPVQLDVTKDESIANAAQMTTDVDILINNAGILAHGNFSDGNILESLKTNLEVNLWGLVKVTNAFFSGMKQRNSGAIVTISSVAGLLNVPSVLAYSISKAAVHSVVQGLREELSKSNILVSGVYPGPVETDMTKGLEIEMESSENVAKLIIQGIRKGEEDIFPDALSQQFRQSYYASSKAVIPSLNAHQKKLSDL